MLLCLSLGWLGGCTTAVTPPDEVDEPVRVALLDHGRSTSLVLPTQDGAMVRYAYGDWRWYALDDTGPWQGLAALFWPTRGALGRRRLAGPLTVEALRREVGPPIQEALIVTVEAAAADRLAAGLDALFEEDEAEVVDNRRYDLTFVHHPEPYSLLNNSNQMTARWLEQLGCRVDGSPLLSTWAQR